MSTPQASRYSFNDDNIVAHFRDAAVAAAVLENLPAFGISPALPLTILGGKTLVTMALNNNTPAINYMAATGTFENSPGYELIKGRTEATVANYQARSVGLAAGNPISLPPPDQFSAAVAGALAKTTAPIRE